MNEVIDIGFITMAFGKDKYFEQAEVLARSLRLHMPQHRIAIVSDRTNVSELFDIVIPLDEFDVAGTFLKTDLYRYSPFEETFFIDSDCVVARNFSAQLNAIRAYDFTPVVGKYLQAGEDDLWLEDVGRALKLVGGKTFPKFNGGVYFYRKSTFAREVFERAIAIRDRSAEIGIIDFDASGPGEETVLGLALSEMGVNKLYNDHGRLMRTPLNSTGPIQLNVLSGECGFLKEGNWVEPAICHFCGEWITHPTYSIAKKELFNKAPLSKSAKLREHATFRVSQLGKKVSRRIDNFFN